MNTYQLLLLNISILIKQEWLQIAEEKQIYILSYNHSFTGIITEVILNMMNSEDSNPAQIPEKINFSNAISGLKLSKDGYFLSLSD